MADLRPVQLQPGLYLVATPIGNLRDISLRALEVLAGVDVVLCEDTRMTGKLLQAHGLKSRLEIYNDHTADKIRGRILESLAQGQRIALVSDAGTPLISDPGYKLVRDAQDLGLNVTAVPGANAVLTALQLSGLPTDKFCFLGFLPPKEKARCDILREWAPVPGTLVIYETASRLIESLSDMARVLGNRPAAVVREMTKIYEETQRGTLESLHAYYEETGAPKGEIVVIVGPPAGETYQDAEIVDWLKKAMAEMSVRDAAAYVAEKTGLPRKRVYDLALGLKK